MGTLIRSVKPGDEGDLAYIQTESWKAAFADILDADTLTLSAKGAGKKAITCRTIVEIMVALV